jgi:hypothetical protein
MRRLTDIASRTGFDSLRQMLAMGRARRLPAFPAVQSQQF